MRDGEKDDPDEVSSADEVIDLGKEVFLHRWDSGSLGIGAGCECVYGYQGKFATGSADFGSSGPYDSLDDALFMNGLLTVTSTTWAVECTMLSATAKTSACPQSLIIHPRHP